MVDFEFYVLSTSPSPYNRALRHPACFYPLNSSKFVQDVPLLLMYLWVKWISPLHYKKRTIKSVQTLYPYVQDDTAHKDFIAIKSIFSLSETAEITLYYTND